MTLIPPRIDDASKQAYLKEAHESSERIRGQVAKIAAESKGLIELAEGPWVCPGLVHFEAFLVVGAHGFFMYPPEKKGVKIKFDAVMAPGFVEGAGAGIAIMAVGPDELIGDAEFQLNAGGVGPGLWNINFYRTTKYLGSFQGGGAVEGIAMAYGGGKFERA
jgi:hypothetical protein